jgi:glycosyltransferase involved in cell wall biosynthesis
MTFAYSVVIPAHNAAATIGETIASILAQTIAPQEIIVVNDGSNDRTAETARRAAPNAVVIDQPNLGPGAATTAGFRRVRSPYIATLDADDLWLPHKIARQAAAFADDPELSGVFSLARQFIDGDPRNAQAGSGEHRLWTRTTLLYRSNAARKVGDFTDFPGRLGEVVDWLARARALGQRHLMVEEVLALRRIRPNSLSQESLRSGGSRGYLAAAHAALRRRKQGARESD